MTDYMETDRRLRDGGGILSATKVADAKAARKPSEKAAAATAAAADKNRTRAIQLEKAREEEERGAFPDNP